MLLIPKPHIWIYIYLFQMHFSSKLYDKRDDFDFNIVNFPFLDDDVLRSTSNCVYISQLIRFAKMSIHVTDFNSRNKILAGKLLQQASGIINFGKYFQNFIADTMNCFLNSRSE